MSKPKTHVAIVLDRSSSMSSTKKQTIEAFNEQVDQIKENAQNQDIDVSLVTFNGNVFEHMWLVPAAELQHASENDYQPNGATAMFDGLGYTIDKLMKTTNPEDENTAYMIIVISDGDENSSREYKGSQLKEMIQGCDQSNKWTFTYMGCSPDSIRAVAMTTGIAVSNCASWNNAVPSAVKLASKHLKDKMGEYYRARRTGEVQKSCLFSPDAQSCADFTQEEISEIKLEKSNIPKINVFDNDQIKGVLNTYEPPLNYHQLINRSIQSNDNFNYIPVHGNGTFDSGNIVEFSNSNQKLNVRSANY